MATYDLKKRRALRDAIVVAQRRHRVDQACRVKSEFLSNVNHEFRTPINAIIGLSGLALKQESSEKVQDYLVKIKQSGEHLLGIINDVLDFSAMESGPTEVEYTSFQLQGVVHEVVNRIKLQADAKGLKLLCDIESDVPGVLLGDPLKLGQILSIYVHNAVKFTHQGQVQIRVGMQYQTNTQVLLRFEVSDTGIGLSEDQITRLFQNHTQIDSSSKRQYGGVGLGLAISKRLAEALGAEVGVESTLGKGSTFWLSVQLGKVQECSMHAGPGSKDEQATGVLKADGEHNANNHPSKVDTRTPVASTSIERLKGVRVLLVEDNAINQQVAYELLTDAGLFVDVAEDGQQAVNCVQARELQETPYDIVLMDLQMPVMDGLTATRLIRLQQVAEELPIVAMTANSTLADRDSCFAAGMNGFLTKPVLPTLLWETLLRFTASRGRLTNSEDMPRVPQIPQAQPEAKSKKLPDHIEGLDLRRGMAFMGNNENLYLKTLQTFADSQTGAIEDIRYLLQSKDFLTAERQVHNLKGQAGYMGATELHNSAQELETLFGRKHVEKDVELVLQAAARQLDALVQAVRHAFVDGTQDPAERLEPQPLARVPLAMVIREMQQLVQRNNPDALQLLERHRSALHRHLDTRLGAIEQALQAFDFELAAKLLRHQ